MSLLAVHLPFDKTGPLNDKLFECGLKLVDSDSQAKIRRFYRTEDAWRGLTGRLLLRYLMKERGITPESASLLETPAGKPFLDGHSIPFNISHDNSLVVLAYGDEETQDIGVDVMKVELPHNETITSFVGILHDQLAEGERAYLSRLEKSEQLSNAFLLWTLKEAYTKALGLGLGFEFSRVEYSFTSQTLSVDGTIPVGWRTRLFDISLYGPAYQCCIAESKRNLDGFELLCSKPEIRYLEIANLVSELNAE